MRSTMTGDRIANLLLIAAILALVGCRASAPIYVCPEVPDIERPTLPAIGAIPECENLPTLDPEVLGRAYRLLEIGQDCLTEPTWIHLLERDRQRREYAEQLEAVLRGLSTCTD